MNETPELLALLTRIAEALEGIDETLANKVTIGLDIDTSNLIALLNQDK